MTRGDAWREAVFVDRRGEGGVPWGTVNSPPEDEPGKIVLLHLPRPLSGSVPLPSGTSVRTRRYERHPGQAIAEWHSAGGGGGSEPKNMCVCVCVRVRVRVCVRARVCVPQIGLLFRAPFINSIFLEGSGSDVGGGVWGRPPLGRALRRLPTQTFQKMPPAPPPPLRVGGRGEGGRGGGCTVI